MGGLRTDFREHIGRVIVCLNQVALTFIANIKVRMSILQNEVFEARDLGNGYVDQGIGRQRQEAYYQKE